MLTKVYKIIDPKSLQTDITDNRDAVGIGNMYGNYTWYHRLVQGSPSRLTRYREYDVMDADVDVSRALDIIAEEMTGNNPKTDQPLEIKLTLDGGRQIPSRSVMTLKAALKTWCMIHDWQRRMYDISRNVIKYGDCFFIKPKNKRGGRLVFIHPKNVVGAVVAQEDVTDIRGWHIKVDSNYSDHGVGSQLYYNVGNNIGDKNVQVYDSSEVIRFTLNNDMSDEAPFGSSVLRAVYRSFKQKELLEDALIIYRVQRAPERKVFYINTGKMPASLIPRHLESIKNEIKQKQIPTTQGGQATVESVYNPMSMSEDYFFAQRSDGSGAKVETLPGGQGLGELQDLEYFYKKVWRGLRIPQSYIDPNSEGGTFSDGKVGIAYLQEIKFSLYIERLQAFIESTLDSQFKEFLRDSGINVDPSLFRVVLPQPSNYSVSKQQAMDSDLLNTYTTADGIPHLSKRFALKKYLQMTPDEIIENERMLREEKGLPVDGDYRDLPKLYYPDDAEAGGFEGGLGGGASGGFGGGELDLGDGGEDIPVDDAEADAQDGSDAQADSGNETPPADNKSKQTNPPR